jgi:hypothetical protein
MRLPIVEPIRIANQMNPRDRMTSLSSGKCREGALSAPAQRLLLDFTADVSIFRALIVQEPRMSRKFLIVPDAPPLHR